MSCLPAEVPAHFPTVYGQGDKSTGGFPLPSFLLVCDLLGIDPTQALRGTGAPVSLPADRVAELRESPPSLPGWGFADTTSPTPLLPRIGFPYSSIPLGTCGEAELLSTAAGVTITGLDEPIAAIFRDPIDGLTVLGSSGDERPAATAAAAELLHALLGDREHLTIVPVGSELTLRPILARLAVGAEDPRGLYVALRDATALRL